MCASIVTPSRRGRTRPILGLGVGLALAAVGSLASAPRRASAQTPTASRPAAAKPAKAGTTSSKPGSTSSKPATTATAKTGAAKPAAAAAGAVASAAGSGQAADGRQIFTSTCASCHQPTGDGVPGTYPPLVGSEWVTGSEDRLVRILLHGLTGPVEVEGETYTGLMPPWGGALKDAEIAAVASYVRSNWGNKAAAVTPATVARVRAATAARKTPWTAGELGQ